MVHTLPAVACVKQKWPDARIHWLVNPEWAPLLRGNPCLAGITEFPRRQFGGVLGWMKFPSWARGLRHSIQPDLVLDFQGLLRSALIGRWSGGEVWGTSDSREGARWLHDKVVPVPARSEPVHAVERSFALIEALGCPRPQTPEWPLPEGTAPHGIELPEGYILLHPFSRGAGKSLEVSEVEQFCRTLAPRPVVIAGRAEVNLPAMGRVTNLLNCTTLPELCWLIRRAAFTVSVDSGPMHIAAALTDKLLAIHTWSDPRRVGPWQPNAWVWKDGVVGRMKDFPQGAECERKALADWVVETAPR